VQNKKATKAKKKQSQPTTETKTKLKHHHHWESEGVFPGEGGAEQGRSDQQGASRQWRHRPAATTTVANGSTKITTKITRLRWEDIGAFGNRGGSVTKDLECLGFLLDQLLYFALLTIF